MCVYVSVVYFGSVYYANSLTHSFTTTLCCSPWGEHEIDYVLFVVIPNKKAITLKPHPDEVDECKWVSPQELEKMMADPKLLFSPWFRIICKKWLVNTWWKDLEETMQTDKPARLTNDIVFHLV